MTINTYATVSDDNGSYDTPPQSFVTLEEFESSALDRLHVLAEIESSFVRNRTWEDLKTVTSAQCKKYLPLNSDSARGIDRDSERRKDHLGHFVLRLAFCRSEDLRRRFVKAESCLFRVRFDTDDRVERERFVGSRNFNWIPLEEDEKQRYKTELMAASQGKNDHFETERYYKVRFTRVPDLVEKRRVFMQGGWVYVPSKEQSSIIFKAFETELEKALLKTAKAIPRLDEDNRITPVLENLAAGFLAGVPSDWLGSSDKPEGEAITADMVDVIAAKHYPLCMKNMHDGLRRDKHLKYEGRLQYGLFLKMLGLSIEESLAFWRKCFSSTSDDKFRKEYQYNIRYNYGLEGQRKNFSAKNCLSIITQNQPTKDQCHGCPYRSHTTSNLSSLLLSSYSHLGFNHAHLAEITRLTEEQHYHVACTRTYEITHSKDGVKKGDGIGGGESVTHPNQYTTKSRDFEKTKVKDEADMSVQMEM